MSRTQIVPAGQELGTPTWEQQYRAALVERGAISASGLLEISRCTDAAFKFISRPGKEASEVFVAGVVVGAVQSGKTGLMINLAARALDSGFRCVIVLAGLRDDLRTQTATRFIRDLLQRGDRIPDDQGGGFTHPKGIGLHGARQDCWAPAVGDDVNHDEAFAYMFSGRLCRGEAVLAVAKKNVTTLNHLRAALEFGISGSKEPAPILVIDDECDEASVSADEDAPTPERIAEVWAGLGQEVAYIGFTATPAANLLQDPTSLLFPGGFVLTMRSPGDANTCLAYLETNADNRYTGGYAYYEFLEASRRENFLVEAKMSDLEFRGIAGHDEALEEALLAYLISGGIRLVEQGVTRFDDPGRLPEPHTMLAHTESTIASHWRLCERIMGIVRRKGGSGDEALGNTARVRPQDRVGAEDLARWLEREPQRWKNWYDNFKRSRSVLLEVNPDRVRRTFPSWSEVTAALTPVFRFVKLRVVNSDDAAVDAPLRFHSTYTSSGPQIPRDIYSIVIGGNRLSRGLTLEGLCISYYTRTAQRLIEDTTVQRERWFGYRSHYLEFCRVFTHASLAIRLRRFHEHDEDLRRQLAWNIANEREPVDATYRFLTIRDSAPTAKLGRGRGPLRVDVSGARAFVDRVQMGGTDAELGVAARNQDVAEFVSRRVHAGGSPLTREGKILGVFTRVQAENAAAVLESLTYTFHNPDPTRGVGKSLREFYRPHDPELPVTDYSFSPSSDPYVIAAYLKYWAHAYRECCSSQGPTRYRSADGVTDWQPCSPPVFNLAIRYGSLGPASSSPFCFELLDREVTQDGRIGSRWGGRRGGVGDEWIDVAPPASGPDAPRGRGTPGLLLVHVIGRQATGRSGLGASYAFDRPCVGVVVPEGGPSLEVVIAEGVRSNAS